MGRRKEPAPPRASGSRRTRAHPSPGGFQELPVATRKPTQSRKKAGADEAASTSMAEPSQDAPALSTTSRSRSPDTHSDSPQPQIPESRSTSPPNEQPPRTITTSRTTTHGLHSGPKRFGVADSKKRARDHDKDDEQRRPAKRPRARTSSLHREEQPQGYASSLSSSSDADEPQPQPFNSLFTRRTPRQQAAQMSSSRPSTTNPSKLIIPAIRSEPESVLTRPDIIDAELAVRKWAESDTTRVVPTPEQMEVLLNLFNAREQAKITIERHPQRFEANQATAAHLEHADTHDNQLDFSDEEEVDNEGAEDAEGLKERSDVPTEIQEPWTPAPVPRPQESHSLWNGISAVKNLISTPLNYFRRRSPSADATNATPVPSEFTFRHSHNLPVAPQIIATPSRRPTASRAGAQTERRGRHQTPHIRVAQSERRPRLVEQRKPPIHLRHITTPSQIAEIQREQGRKKQREAESNRVEDMDGDITSMQSAQAGEKRKRPQREPRTPVKTPSCTFRVPSPTSSDDDTDDDEEAEVEAEGQNIDSVSKSLVRNNSPIKSADSPQTFEDPNDPINYVPLPFGPNNPFWAPIDLEAREAKFAAERERDILREQNRMLREVGATENDPNNGRVPRYTGSIARQPPVVQANIDEGLSPLAPRSSTMSHMADGNIFAAIADSQREPLFAGSTKSQTKYLPLGTQKGPLDPLFKKGSVRRWIEANPELMTKTSPKVLSDKVIGDTTNGANESSALPATFGSITPSGTPKVTKDPVNGAKESSTSSSTFRLVYDEDLEDTTQNSPQGSGPLASKKWEQTPPPKPRLSNAQLPKQQAHQDQALEDPLKLQTPQEQTQRANALKYAPVRPSGLRNMTKMSPLGPQGENNKENRNEKEVGISVAIQNLIWDNTSLFCKEVNDAIAAIPEEKIVPMELPAELYQNWPKLTEAERAVEELLN